MIELDRSAWKINDKEWRKTRREEWKTIKGKLKHTTINTRMNKHLKQYFMDGSIDDELPEYFYTFYKMWLHPDQSEENLRALFDSITGAGDYRYVFKLFGEFGHNTFLELGENGLLGGREELFVRIIYPGVYTSDVLDFDGSTEPVLRVHAPSFFSGFCVVCSDLMLDENSYRYKDSQFMIDFWFSTFEYGDLTRPEIDWLFRGVYYFDEVGVDDGPEGNRRRFAEKMREALDTRVLPQPLADKWAWIKTPEGHIPTEAEAGSFKGWEGKWDGVS